jgi:hypothetical protein
MPVEYELVKALRVQVADAMTRVKQDRERRGDPELSEPDERQLALSLITSAVQAYQAEIVKAGGELPADTGYDLRLIMAVDAAIYAAGELQELLDDDQVENIDINGCDEVWITYADRGKVRGAPIAATDEDLIGIVQNLAAYASINARPFTRANPELDLRLPDGSRLSAVMGAGERPAVSIRRNRYPQMFLAQLIELGTIDEQLAVFLQAAVRARMNLIIAGATDAGKTTLGATHHGRTVPGVGASPAGPARRRRGVGGGPPGRRGPRRHQYPAIGPPDPATQPVPRLRRRGAGTRSCRDAFGHEPGEQWFPFHSPCQVGGGRVRQARPVRRAVRADREPGRARPDRRRGRLRGLHRQEPSAGRSPHRH